MGGICGRLAGMAGGITKPALGCPMGVERRTGGATGSAAVVAGGPPGISGLDIHEIT